MRWPRAFWNSILIAAAALAISACTGATAPRSDANPHGSSSTTTTSSTALVDASLPVAACPTTVAIAPPPSSTSPPSSLTVKVPSDLVSQLAIYADQSGIMRLLGPRGWVCAASYGADGSGGVTVYPTGEPTPDNLQPFKSSSSEALVGSETSACSACREGQACPLFSSAASDYQRDYNMTCPSSRPTAERVDQIGPGVVGFQDPPNVAGDGVPSGGPYPANGVMTYYSGNENGSWLDTCTLPASQQTLCTMALNTFVAWYGSN